MWDYCPGIPQSGYFRLPFPLALSREAELYVIVLLIPKGVPMDEIHDPLSEEIERLHAEHRRYAQRLEELIQKPYLSEDEQLEEVRLKKLKLHAKDLIYALERRTAVMA
jgi:hypothetical protein